jgi:YD repeat-containing protein
VLRRCFFLPFLFGVLQCALSAGAAAQSSDPCLPTTVWYFPDPVPMGWFYYGTYPGTYAYRIAAVSALCSPPDPAPPCPTCGTGGGGPGGPGPPVGGRPINLASGNTYIQETDLRIPGLSGGLSLIRTWNSKWPSSQSAYQVGLFGPNWRSTYEEQVFVGSDHYIKYLRADGSIWSFGTTFGSGGGVRSWAVAAPQQVAATGTTPNTATPYFTIAFQNGEQRRFDSTSGLLTAIIDRNGNTTTLAYDGANRLVTVTDPASRHLTFTYASSSSHLVTGVSSDVGISLSYAYDGQGRLSQVTNPDLTTLSFAYNSQSLITTVTDSSGKILESHTYDSSGRGLTSSRAAGVESVTLSYPNP